MVSQDDFPEKWSCDSENKGVRVEIRVPEFGDVEGQDFLDQLLFPVDVPEETITGYTWIEIPTQSVEQWVEKGEAARIQRTAKVRYPTEWGRDDETIVHNSPREIIQGFDPEGADAFLHARIWWHDNTNDTWVLAHYGWVGGTGSTGDAGISKLWIYDFAELLSGVPISKTFNRMNSVQALEHIAVLTNENTSAPIAAATMMFPESEEEFLRVTEAEDTDETVRNLGLDRSGTPYYALGEESPRAELSVTESGNFETEIIGADFGDVREGTPDVGNEPDVYEMGPKTFGSNHDTLLDVWEWFENQTGAKMHFEPTADGDAVRLVADVIPSRRTFTAQSVIERRRDDGESFEYHEPVTVTKNDALYEIKPLNTLHLRGAYARGATDGDTFLDDTESAVGSVMDGDAPPGKHYPSVKVQAPALVEAANGVELAPKVVESDVTSLDAAKEQAKKKLSEKISEVSEGEVDLFGEPRMLPFDRLEAFEVCNGYVQYEQEAVEYEIVSVKHQKTSQDVYRTSLRVGIWANEQNIEVIEAKMVEESV